MLQSNLYTSDITTLPTEWVPQIVNQKYLEYKDLQAHQPS